MTRPVQPIVAPGPPCQSLQLVWEEREGNLEQLAEVRKRKEPGKVRQSPAPSLRLLFRVRRLPLPIKERIRVLTQDRVMAAQHHLWLVNVAFTRSFPLKSTLEFIEIHVRFFPRLRW